MRDEDAAVGGDDGPHPPHDDSSANDEPPPRATPSSTGLTLFLSANLALTFANGIQLVILAWLVTHVLAETPERVGLAQASLMLPGLALTLIGGLVADRFDARRLLPPLHLLGVIPIAVVALFFARDSLTYAVMIGYALAMGALGAFLGPARDALLYRVADGAIQRTVTLQLTASYLGQLAGFLLTAIEAVPPLWAMAVQAAALACAAGCYVVLRPALPHSGRLGGRGGVREIADALRETLSLPRLRSALAIQLSIGVLLAGSWTVILQLLVRDVYGGGRGATSLFFGSMMVGTLIGTVWVAARGGVVRMGIALLVGLSMAAIGSIGIALAPPLPLAIASIVLWGAGGGTAMVMTRTISQESAPATHRARVLSLFQLAIIGGAPIGAYAAGLVASRFGSAAGAWLPALGLLAVVLLALATSELRQVVREAGGEAAA